MDSVHEELRNALLEIEHRVRKVRLEILPGQVEETSDIAQSKPEIAARALKLISQLAQLEHSTISTRSVRDIERLHRVDGSVSLKAVGKTTFMLKIEYDGSEWRRQFGEESDAPE